MAQQAAPLRRRGRPAGKNRVPLSLEERRARNAHYEKMRREETSEAINDLAEAIGCNPGTSQADIIATVVNYLQRAQSIDSSDNIDSLRRCNEKLMMQIQSIEHRIASDSQLAGLDTSSASSETDDDGCMKIQGYIHKKGRKRMKLEQPEIEQKQPEIHQEQLSPAESYDAKYNFTAIPTSSTSSNYDQMLAPLTPSVPEDFMASAEPSGTGDTGLLDSLQSSWSGFGDLKADSNRMQDYNRWSIDDFILEYL